MGVSRQLMIAYVSSALGLLVSFGVIPQVVVDQFTQNPDQAIGGVMFVYGILLAILRKITSTPLVGWIFKVKTSR